MRIESIEERVDELLQEGELLLSPCIHGGEVDVVRIGTLLDLLGQQPERTNPALLDELIKLHPAHHALVVLVVGLEGVYVCVHNDIYIVCACPCH